MKVVLALLAALFVAVANANALYNLTDEFTASCAVSSRVHSYPSQYDHAAVPISRNHLINRKV